MSNDPNRPRPDKPGVRPSGVTPTPKPSTPKKPKVKISMPKIELKPQRGGKGKKGLMDCRIEKDGKEFNIEAGSTWTNTESGKQYIVLGVGDGRVHIQNATDPEVKFEVVVDRFIEIYAPSDTSINLFTPDPKRFTFDRMVLYEEAIVDIKLGVNRILKYDLMEKIWNISQLEPHRKLALSLYGPPGTGKTQAAKCIATMLGKKMLQCDYAQMISKWHGDTGKHIKAAFETAAKHDAILFLDEADSLVSQRVSLSADRMSIATAMNSDRNVFMQELDKFQGIVIFTTNFFGNYDAAIVRRVAKHIHFRLPNQEMRERIYKIHMPNMKRVRDVDWTAVAKESQGFSGGDIFQVMVNAINRASLPEDTNDWWMTHEHMITEVRETAEAKAAHGGKTTRGSGSIVAPSTASSVKVTTVADEKAGEPSRPPTASTGPTKAEWEASAYDEDHLILSIQNQLLTAEQKAALKEHDLTICDTLNGRFNASQESLVLSLFEAWNAKLGWKEFSFNTSSKDLRAAIQKNLSGLT